MASEVEICNRALSNLGDSATVASIDPPEGSAQAEHCQRFYPMARDSLLEMAKPSFAMRRAPLAPLLDVPDSWQFAYAKPANALVILGVMAEGEADDFADPTAYVCEADASGNEVIYTNIQNAQVRYILRVVDSARFTPLFAETLSWLLAAMLAGPVIKGDEGRAEAKRCKQMMAAMLEKFAVADANQRRVRPTHSPTWIQGR